MVRDSCPGQNIHAATFSNAISCKRFEDLCLGSFILDSERGLPAVIEDTEQRKNPVLVISAVQPSSLFQTSMYLNRHRFSLTRPNTFPDSRNLRDILQSSTHSP